MALSEAEKALASQVTLQNGDKRLNEVSKSVVDGVECVGNVVITFEHVFLYALYLKDGTKYANLSNGSINLTGFKLESLFLDASQQIPNSKLIPLLNGDTMTLVNACKAGQLSIGCTRTAAGINGGDMVAIFDFIRSQGDSYGGRLTAQWLLNGSKRKVQFQSVTVADCVPVKLAGNDLPDYSVKLNFARFLDNDAAVA